MNQRGVRGVEDIYDVFDLSRMRWQVVRLDADRERAEKERRKKDNDWKATGGVFVFPLLIHQTPLPYRDPPSGTPAVNGSLSPTPTDGTPL